MLRDRRFEVIEHGRDDVGDRRVAPKKDAIFRVVSFGASSDVKGLDLVEALARAVKARNIEIHALGGTTRRAAPEVHDHGPYERDRLFEILSEIAPDVALIPSRLPETYSHVLTEAWGHGLPVIAIRRAALEERIELHGGGWLVPPRDTGAVVELVLRLSRSPDEVRAVAEQVDRIHLRSVGVMAADYERLYTELAGSPREAPREQPRSTLVEAELRARKPSPTQEPVITPRYAMKVLLYQIPGARKAVPWVMKRYRRKGS
ncbi:MAG: glycosyltransferase family 4 protein [Myxococcales bacterium]|nr:glycosyltransferase family 4 protein [Myxococcales bacterium]